MTGSCAFRIALVDAITEAVCDAVAEALRRTDIKRLRVADRLVNALRLTNTAVCTEAAARTMTAACADCIRSTLTPALSIRYAM